MRKYLCLFAACLFMLLCGCSKTCKTHTDANADHLCDNCGESTVVILDVYAINDLHGKIMDADTHPGVDELTTYLENARETDDHVLLLSVGDMWQGSAESNLTKGELMTRWMNEIGFDAMAMGNHEFDWGEDPVEANAEIADFPFLAINIYDRETDQQVSYCKNSLLVNYGTVQIGIIGAIGDCYSSISPEQVKDIYFKTGNELTQLVKAESDSLRQQGADFIIYMIHDGASGITSDTTTAAQNHQFSEYYSTSLSENYVDLVFEAHTHHKYLLRDHSGVLHLQHGGDNNGGISHVEIQLDAITGETDILEAELVSTSVYESLEDSPIVAQVLEDYEEQIAPAFEPIGTISTSVPGDSMRQLVADLYYMTGLMHWGDQYDIFLGGGYISIRQPGYLAKGDITYAQLMSLFPFDNELVLCSIKGRDLEERFLNSDNDNYFISYGEYGESLLSSIDPNGTYYIVVDTYSSSYGPNRLTEIARYEPNVFARDLIAEYIAIGGIQ